MSTLKKLFNKYEELISYAFFGVLTTLVNIGTFFVLEQLFENHYVINNTIAWFVSVLFAFITNKLFVFKSKSWEIKGLLKEIVLFFGTRLLTLFIDDGIMIIGVKFLHLGTLITKVIDQVVIIILNFILSKLSFKH